MPEEKPYMTIHLPTDLENSLRAEVSIGHFASLDDAMAEAVRLLLRNRTQRQPEACPDTSLGSIGAMRDAADELDEIVADAYRKRQQEPWRDISVE
jgi:Arc/MetJ-type ribon-helix-helix transcriptional regulator